MMEEEKKTNEHHKKKLESPKITKNQRYCLNFFSSNINDFDKINYSPSLKKKNSKNTLNDEHMEYNNYWEEEDEIMRNENHPHNPPINQNNNNNNEQDPNILLPELPLNKNMVFFFLIYF